MTTDTEALRQCLDALADEDLLARLEADSLTPEAQRLARELLSARGINLFGITGVRKPVSASDYQGDMVILVRKLEPIEAHLICNTLHAGGIPAETGDTQLVQANALLSIAIGGACVRVPEACLAPARELLAAYRRGALALDDDFDVGAPQD